MEILNELEHVVEHGTSAITLCIPPKPQALPSALDTLKREFAAADNIKSRV